METVHDITLYISGISTYFDTTNISVLAYSILNPNRQELRFWPQKRHYSPENGLFSTLVLNDFN